MIILFLLGYLLMFTGALWLIVKCFQENLAWGICSIFFPGLTWLLFLILHPAECWRPTATYIAGIVCLILPLMLLPQNMDLADSHISNTNVTSSNKTIDLLPYRTVHKGIEPVLIERVAIRDISKVKYFDITFHDYFLDGRSKMFAIEHDGKIGLLNATRIEKDLCDSETIARIRAFAGTCMNSNK